MIQIVPLCISGWMWKIGRLYPVIHLGVCLYLCHKIAGRIRILLIRTIIMDCSNRGDKNLWTRLKLYLRKAIKIIDLAVSAHWNTLKICTYSQGFKVRPVQFPEGSDTWDFISTQINLFDAAHSNPSNAFYCCNAIISQTQNLQFAEIDVLKFLHNGGRPAIIYLFTIRNEEGWP